MTQQNFIFMRLALKKEMKILDFIVKMFAWKAEWEVKKEYDKEFDDLSSMRSILRFIILLIILGILIKFQLSA